MTIIQNIIDTIKGEAQAPTVVCPFRGRELLNNSRFNKGTAFTKEERTKFGLHGLLPAEIVTLQTQTDRAYGQYKRQDNNLTKNWMLNLLSQQNEVLFFNLLKHHLKEMLPVIYTPTEGEAIQKFSKMFDMPQALFLNIDMSAEDIRTALNDWPEITIDYIICSDGEEILGVGDQGVDGAAISTAKGMLMTLCAGMHPSRILPIGLDVGTNRDDLRADPLYLGLRKARGTREEYDRFMNDFINETRKKFPQAMIHFEDFGISNGRRLLEQHKENFACFNDDIQGTSVVTRAAVSAALKVTGKQLKETKFVIFGAGSAGCGISDLLMDAMKREGIDEKEAIEHFWLVDKQGLLVDSDKTLNDAQKVYARSSSEYSENTSLLDTIKKVKPNALIGVSTCHNGFTQEVCEEMAKHNDRPIIFPLSNPTSLVEAEPKNIIKWTKGKALITTGSPFDPVEFEKEKIEIGECNNALIYPGLGLAAVLCKAKKITTDLMHAAADALAKSAPSDDGKSTNSLLPDVECIARVSFEVCAAVITEAVKRGLANQTDIPLEKGKLEQWIRERQWTPIYPVYN